MDEELIEALKALAHPLRWRIVSTLAAGERNVGEIEQATGIGQPGLSQQLGVLRKAGLVDTRKEAKLVFYSISPDAVVRMTTAIAAIAPQSVRAAPQPDVQRTPAPGAANFARMS